MFDTFEHLPIVITLFVVNMNNFTAMISFLKMIHCHSLPMCGTIHIRHYIP